MSFNQMTEFAEASTPEFGLKRHRCAGNGSLASTYEWQIFRAAIYVIAE